MILSFGKTSNLIGLTGFRSTSARDGPAYRRYGSGVGFGGSEAVDRGSAFGLAGFEGLRDFRFKA